MSDRYKRVNILIRPDHHEKVMAHGLSLSGLVRDLLDDRFSDTVITLSVSKETRDLYDRVVSNFGVSDADLERFFVKALDDFLEVRSQEIERIRSRLQDR